MTLKLIKRHLGFALLLGILIFSLTASANDGKDIKDGTEVLGVWQGDNLQERFEIYKKGDLFYGRIVWTAYDDIDGNGLKDVNNPDPEKREQSILGLEILLEFKYKGNGVYNSGRVYDPGSGNFYKCKIKVDGDMAKVRGFVLMPLLGRTEIAYRFEG